MALLATMFLGQVAYADSLWFLDTFTVSANNNDVNFEYNAVGRQSGGIAPITYTMEPNTSAWYAFAHQVGNGGNPGALLMTAADYNPGTQGRVSPDFNFKTAGTNRISFDVIPGSTSWEAINFGADSAGRNQFINGGNAGFGILFQPNGNFQAFNNGTQIAPDTLYTATPGTNHILIEIHDADGNPWDGVGSTVVDLYADGSAVPFFSYSSSPGYTNNYITVQGFGSYNDGFFDNLAFSADSAPPLVAPTPTITQIYPDGMRLQQQSGTLSFTVTNTIAISATNIQLTLNGTNAWPALNFTGNNTTVLTASMPLVPSTIYTLALTAFSTNGLTSATKNFTFDTFSPACFTWEAEDWNYSTNGGASGGLYIDNPPINAYRNFESAYGIDANPISWPLGPFQYRTNDWVATSVCSDMPLPSFAAAALTNSGIANYNVDFWGAGTWQQYTRTFPPGTYYIYARVASAETIAKVVDLTEIDGSNNPVVTNGTFALSSSGTGGWQNFAWIPLIDTNTSLKVPVTLNGTKTFRVANTSTTELGALGLNLNLFMLVPTNPAVAIAPFSVSATQSGGNIALAFATQSGATYSVYFKTNLTDASWFLKTNISGSGATAIVNDSAVGASRFYRVGAN